MSSLLSRNAEEAVAGCAGVTIGCGGCLAAIFGLVAFLALCARFFLWVL